MALNCLIVDTNDANRLEMAMFLSRHGAAVEALDSVEHLLTALSRPEPPRLVAINLDPKPHEMIQKLAPIMRRHGQSARTHFVVMSQNVDSSLLMEAIPLGVKEFVPLPIDREKFLACLHRLTGDAAAKGRRAKIINFIPAAGGCGATTIACNVAASLARSGRTLLIDLDLVRGCVAPALDLRPKSTLADVMDPAMPLDRAALENALTLHAPTGLAVLPRPEVPEHAERIDRAGLDRLLGIAGRVFDYIVIDSMMSTAPLYVAAVQNADVNVMVMQLNVPAARNAERFIAAMRRMGVEPHKVKVVVSRFNRKSTDLAAEEVEKSLGTKIAWMVPNDFKNALAAINYGEPVVLRSPRGIEREHLRVIADAERPRDEELSVL